MGAYLFHTSFMFIFISLRIALLSYSLEIQKDMVDFEHVVVNFQAQRAAASCENR